MHLHISIRKCGLTNQIFQIVNFIFDIIENKKYNKTKKIVIIDSFNKDGLNQKLCQIDEILDIDYINTYLEEYNIILIPKNKIRLEFVKIDYGCLGMNTIEITDKLKDICTINEKYLCIEKNINLNDLYFDPLPGILKYVYLYYKINGIDYFTFEREFHSRIIKNLEIDLENREKNLQETQLNTITLESRKNILLFNEILKNMKFANLFYDEANKFIDKINKKYEKISVIHLRNEADAIPFWGSINKMSNEDFKNTLNNKYNSLIDKYLLPTESEIIIVLSSEVSNNDVIEYLKFCGFNYVFMEKNIDEREIDAINDLIITKCCNNIFLGNYNPNTFNGSTFSYVISNLMEKNVKKVLIDLDNINENEYIL
jgi:hypothetical protein